MTPEIRHEEQQGYLLHFCYSGYPALFLIFDLKQQERPVTSNSR